MEKLLSIRYNFSQMCKLAIQQLFGNCVRQSRRLIDLQEFPSGDIIIVSIRICVVIAHDIEVKIPAVAPSVQSEESPAQYPGRRSYGTGLSRKGKTGMPVNSTSASNAFRPLISAVSIAVSNAA